MEVTTDILNDEHGFEFQFQVVKDRLKIRMGKERRFDAVTYDCFSMKRDGVMSFSKLYNSRGHFVRLTPARVLEILEDLPPNREVEELRKLAVIMKDK